MPAWRRLSRLYCLLVFCSNTSPVLADSNTALQQDRVRVVSLAPNITEIIFALDAEDKLVGVTRYCDYPPEAGRLPKVGGFSDPNLEAIVALQPTVVFGLPEHEPLKRTLAGLKIRTFLNKQHSLSDIFVSIKLVGDIVGRKEAATQLVEEMKKEISSIQKRVAGRAQPTVLLTVGGHVKRGSLDAVYAAGPATLYHELIELAGGANIFRSKLEYAKLSAEAILTLDPEVIVDLVPSEANTSSKERSRIEKETLAAWKSLAKLQAVRQERVHIFSDEFVINPGPRIAKTLRLFAGAFHPGVLEDAPR